MLELLSLTRDNDLVLTKTNNYYFCLVEPSKRKYGLDWYEAMSYCKSLGKDYSLPSRYELDLIYTNKGDISLIEACLYGDEINTLDFISIYPTKINQHKFYPWVRNSNDCCYCSSTWCQSFDDGFQISYYKNGTNNWTLPVRKIKC